MTLKEQLDSFVEYAREHQADENASIDLLYESWRVVHIDDAEYEQNIQDVREALDLMDSGDAGMTIDEFKAQADREFGHL
ncbi:hypothetical protein [Lacunimicrobium album]